VALAVLLVLAPPLVYSFVVDMRQERPPGEVAIVLIGIFTVIFLAPFGRPVSRLWLQGRGTRCVGVVEKTRGFSLVYGTLLVRRSATVRFVTADGKTRTRRVPVGRGVQTGQQIVLAHGRWHKARAIPRLPGRHLVGLTLGGLVAGFLVLWCLTVIMAFVYMVTLPAASPPTAVPPTALPTVASASDLANTVWSTDDDGLVNELSGSTGSCSGGRVVLTFENGEALAWKSSCVNPPLGASDDGSGGQGVWQAYGISSADASLDNGTVACQFTLRSGTLMSAVCLSPYHAQTSSNWTLQ
jgi:hypothetical protein